MDRYKGLGFKLTPQRLAVLKFLDGNKTHPSAEEVYKAVLESFPTVSFATVYNTLNTLKERGKILELSIDTERKRFDPNASPHHHLICIKCKKIVDVYQKYPIDVPNDDKQGFEIVGSHIEFYGICAKCKNENPEGENEEANEMAEAEVAMGQYVCGMCGYIYDPAKGDKKGKIPPGVAFEDLPEDWKCPLCGVGKFRFEPMQG